MKKTTLIALAALLASSTAFAQPSPFGPRVQPDPPGGIRIPDAPQLPYHFGTKPQPPNGEKFGNVSSLTLKNNGNLLVFNRNPAIMMIEYDPTGTRVIRTFNPNIASNPHGLRVDRHNNIWITDSFMNVVWKLNEKGEPIRMFGKRGENAPWDDTKWNGMFNQPLDIAFDKDDNFYVVQSHAGTSPPADCTYCATYDSVQTRNAKVKGPMVSNPPAEPGGDPRIMKFDKDGNLLASASLARTDGLLPTTHTVVISPKGEVWVGDRASAKIVAFDKDLKIRRDIPLTNMPSGLFVDAKGELWAATGRHGMILKLDWNGKTLGWYGKAGSNKDANETGEAHFMAVSADQKTIYVADSVNAQVLKMERN